MAGSKTTTNKKGGKTPKERGRGTGPKETRRGKTGRGSGRGQTPRKPVAEAPALPALKDQEQAPVAEAPGVFIKTEPPQRPPTGEMQRMLQGLKNDKSETGKQTLLDYKTLEGHVAKRTFYYDRFLSLPKENARFEARKTHGSDKTWSEREKDMGWVEEDFIAARKGLKITRMTRSRLLNLGIGLAFASLDLTLAATTLQTKKRANTITWRPLTRLSNRHPKGCALTFVATWTLLNSQTFCVPLVL